MEEVHTRLSCKYEAGRIRNGSKRKSSQIIMFPQGHLKFIIITAVAVFGLLFLLHTLKTNFNIEVEANNVILLRLKNAINKAWKVNKDQDDRQLLSKRLNILSMELNQYICDLSDEVNITFIIIYQPCTSGYTRSYIRRKRIALKVRKII